MLCNEAPDQLAEYVTSIRHDGVGVRGAVNCIVSVVIQQMVVAIRSFKADIAYRCGFLWLPPLLKVVDHFKRRERRQTVYC